LQFLGTLVDHVSPAIHNVYLLRRLRAKAGAAERARVSRELHDGAVQALIGLEMEIQALRLGKGHEAGLDAELEYMQSLVRRQGLELRELMLQLRPLDLDSTDRLPDLLASMVEKFRRDTGISARFVSTTDRMTIPPRSAVELARIVQEALVNVRRHSRASNVLVRLDGDRDGWTLTIDDDGRGFGFSGRLSGRELDAMRLGPAVIRERARAIGAALVIDSRPGSGARLEITLAGAVHA
jgi:signal transduction histidine kinase